MAEFVMGLLIGGGVFGLVGFLLGGKSAIDYANKELKKRIDEWDGGFQ
jgi:hypothetical protein